MEKTNSLLDRKDTIKETTHRNLRKIYIIQVKSYRNIFRAYQKQDNFSTELELRGVMSHLDYDQKYIFIE